MQAHPVGYFRLVPSLYRHNSGHQEGPSQPTNTIQEGV
jgi:hypothetical protein